MADDHAADVLRAELAALRRQYDEVSTELRELRGALVQLGKLAELGRMAAALVHEMNQPLVGIKSFAQIVKRRLDPADPNLAKVQLIEDQAVQLEALVDRLRRFTRKASTRMERLDLHGPIQAAAAIMEGQVKKQGVALEIRAAPDLPPIVGNPNQLQQLVVNLLSNARDAVLGRDDRRILVATRAHAGSVELAVADTGAGVAPELRARIFEPFFTTKDEEQGTGLGLTICRELAALHGAEVALADQHPLHAEGFRTVFAVSFPPA